MVTLACALGASAAEAYACYTPSNTTLTFYYDTQRSSRSGTTYDLNTELMFPDWNSDSTNAKVTQVIFHQSFANTCPTSTYAWFEGMSRLQSIVNINYLNTSEVTYMSYMFQGCTGLTSLDLTHFNTAKVKSMSYMFNNCSGLMSIDVRSFNTSKVGNMYSIFAECTGLTSLDLGSFDTSQLRLSSQMFYNCSNLQTIYASDDFTMAGVTSDKMFSGCISLVGGQGTVYSGYHTNGNYAHIDGGPSNPGYFTAKGGTALRGDVNGDGNVSIADVSVLIDLLLSGSSITNPAADVNQDSNVSIADVSALIDYLLGSSW